jgi:hypothetical protein
MQRNSPKTDLRCVSGYVSLRAPKMPYIVELQCTAGEEDGNPPDRFILTKVETLRKVLPEREIIVDWTEDVLDQVLALATVEQAEREWTIYVVVIMVFDGEDRYSVQTNLREEDDNDWWFRITIIEAPILA